MRYLKWIGVLLGTVLILLFGFYLYYFEILEDDYFNNNASQYLVNENYIAVNGYDLTEYFISNILSPTHHSLELGAKIKYIVLFYK